ncbi:hypothetical protein [Streptomyces sp. KL116D]|uniref:hypothetical protein n=1 Tax=Streptomyces sp. KL116D TaxID=3045152 RepID=UPI00355620D6
MYVAVPLDADSMDSAQRLVAIDTATGKQAWTRTADVSHPAALFSGGVACRA